MIYLPSLERKLGVHEDTTKIKETFDKKKKKKK